MEADDLTVRCSFASPGQAWSPLADGVDMAFLSSELAGGFTGTYAGVFATANGEASGNVADVDWFEYLPLPHSRTGH
jgi:alpha-N-arabinofuranosidase